MSERSKFGASPTHQSISFLTGMRPDPPIRVGIAIGPEGGIWAHLIPSRFGGPYCAV
jgi:hypothetical protein